MSTAFEKQKLCHSLGRPSRSDFVQFEVYADKAGEFRFRLKATNGQVIAVSEGYATHANCLNGVESVKKNAPEAEVVSE